MRRRRPVIVVGCLLALVAVAYLWWNAPARKVPRLLREIAERPTGKFAFVPGRAMAAIDADFDRIGADAVPPLVRSLGDPNGTIRYLAAGQLGRRRDARATPALVASLGDPEAVVRKWAAGALGDIGDRSAVEPLIRCLDDADGGVRFVAAEALGKLGDARAAEPLVRLLDDAAIYPRAYAATALGALGDARAIPALTRAAGQDPDSWVVREAQQSLRRLGATRSSTAPTPSR